MANGDGKFITWKEIVFGFAGVLLLLLAGIVADTRQGVSQAQDKIEKKVDKEQYRCDIERVEGKLDKLIIMHMNGNNKK